MGVHFRGSELSFGLCHVLFKGGLKGKVQPKIINRYFPLVLSMSGCTVQMK